MNMLQMYCFLCLFEVSAIVQNKYSLVYEGKSLVVGGICGTN